MKQTKYKEKQTKYKWSTPKPKRAENNNASKKKKSLFDRLKEKIFGTSSPPVSSQDTIDYIEMFEDGICQVDEKLFTKSIEFGDINYQLAQNEDKTLIFSNYCDFLNYFDESVSVQLSFINKFANVKDFEKLITIENQNDNFDTIRQEYSTMLKNQMAKGNNGLVKSKYVTFGIEADSLREAKTRLEKIETNIINNFKIMGVRAEPLSGEERLEIIHGQLHPDGETKFDFEWNDLEEKKINTKDVIAPSTFNFTDKKMFKMGKTIGSTSFVQIIASELTDRMLADYLNTDDAITVNIHIKSLDQATAVKNVKRVITDVDAMKIAEQKKAVRAGYDMDILPPDIQNFSDESKKLLNELQSRNERMFQITIIILNTAKKKTQLEEAIFSTVGLTQKYNCRLAPLEWQQEQGLMSSLPLGKNHIPIKRGLTTSATAIFVPFTTQELFQIKEASYYGLNALSNNLIMANRKELKNPNGLILGTPGSGKSFAAKREMTNVFLTTEDDVIICDPEGEYTSLVDRLNGQLIMLSSTSTDYVNPLDIHMNYGDGDDPIIFKSEFILSLFQIIAGGAYGLTAQEISIIDRCTAMVYRKYFEDPVPEKMPILGDLYDAIKSQPEPEAINIVNALEVYVTGSLRVFNNRTNVNLENRVVCFNIKGLGNQLKKLGMLIFQDAVWNRVTINRDNKKSTWLYIDEFHLLLKEAQSASYSVAIWKRFRKWGGIPTGLTQNVKDLLASPEIENIFENSDFILMLNQAAGDRKILAEALSISKHQLSYVTQSGAGEGLIFYGNTIIPFIDRFPKNTELYKIMTTKLDEV